MTFKEVRYASPVVSVVTVAIGLAVAANLLVSTWSSAASGAEQTLFVSLAVAVIALCVAVARMSTVTLVGPDGVELVFRVGITVWRRRIPWSEIAVDGVERVSVMRAGGLGLRYLGGGRIALMVRPGPGVVLQTRERRNTYVVGSDRTSELLHVLTHRTQ